MFIWFLGQLYIYISQMVFVFVEFFGLLYMYVVLHSYMSTSISM